MAKATITLPNGTAVIVEGSIDEVNALLSHYSSQAAPPAKPVRSSAAASKPKRGRSPAPGSRKSAEDDPAETVDITEIVNLVKNCDEAEQMETQILDRTSQVNRTLLPLYVVHEYLDNRFGLSSGEISKVTTQLGVPVSQANVAHTLSGSASRYVMGDRVRVKGKQVKYKLSRRGLKYLNEVLAGTSGEK